MKCRDVIESERLRLRRPERRDSPAIVAALNDWSIAQWLTIPPYPYTDAAAEAFLRCANEPDSNGFNGKFVVADRESDQLQGVVTLSQDGDREELGYWLRSSAQGRGYMTEAVQALLTESCKLLQPAVIFATTDPENSPSKRVLRRNGFVETGARQLDRPRKRGTTTAIVFQLAR
jgi:RimJ/RimL family protein N-acetyltransferase